MTVLFEGKENTPILEFDPIRSAIIEPQGIEVKGGMPEIGIFCFFYDVLEDLQKQNVIKKIGAFRSEMGEQPLFELVHNGDRFFVLHPGVGAPLAVGFLDEMIANGGKKFVAAGGCGVINEALPVGMPVILTEAVRDEGTSYHYLPPSRTVESSPLILKAIQSACENQGLSYHLGKSWTTDAIYRETIAKTEMRLKEGCDVVEMEAAAFFAVAQFREVDFGQIVYGGDLVIPNGYDERDWNKRVNDRERLFWLAVEACHQLV
ncbi:MAG: nucleoside phosphorylase [Anaerolineaceae bacterium]|nr:nucleoside phosphorylase [Anaerolineaceae bacterium]